MNSIWKIKSNKLSPNVKLKDTVYNRYMNK